MYGARAGEVVRVADAEGVISCRSTASNPTAYRRTPTIAAHTSLDALVAHNSRSAKAHSGIWRDLAVRHRPTEVDKQLGPLVETGALHEIPTPLNARVIAMIHDIERGERAHSPANLDELGAAER